MAFRTGAAALAATMCLAGVAEASSVNGTGLITPDVIYGSGNANGGFTGVTSVDGIELGLRAHQRYPAANIFNYDGNRTYTFDSTVLTTNPSNRSVFNFDWAINVDSTGLDLADYTFMLGFDTDSSAGVSYTYIDLFNTPLLFDHALGTLTTGNGGGIVSTSNADLLANSAIYTVAQNSANLGFGYSTDPDAPGIYDFRLIAFSGSTELASTDISVEVLPLTPVPLPASLPLLAGVLGLGGLFGWRRRRANKV